MTSLYDQNLEFNEILEETYGQVVLGRSKFSPAKILFELDKNAYLQDLANWKVEKNEKLLELAHEALNYGDNERRFQELTKFVSRKRIIPFVGAGLSIPCDNPGWRAFLLQLSERVNIDCVEIEKRLNCGEYEEVAEELIDELGTPGFNEIFDGTFVGSESLRGSVLLLPELTTGSVITTNLDTILEDVYQNANCIFNEIVIGNQKSEFIRALANGERHILKLHGNVKTTQSRVLTKSEYCGAYGSEKIDFSQPLPDTLRRVFSHHILLFLGSSLGPDRTMELFHEVVKEIGEESELPRHYAIAERPKNKNDIKGREKFLNDRMIFPIWYPPRQHEHVEAFLTLLIENK